MHCLRRRLRLLLCLLPALAFPLFANDLPLLWQYVPATEVRQVSAPRLQRDALGWHIRAPGPVENRFDIDPLSGLLQQPGLVGIPLLVNGGSALLDFTYAGDICYGSCRVTGRFLLRFDAQGVVRWTYALPGDFSFGDQVGAEVLAEWPGLVLVTYGNTVFALDDATGALRWSFGSASCTLSSLAPGRYWQRCAEGAQDAVLALDQSGQQQWAVALPLYTWSVKAQAGGRIALVSSSAAGLRWQMLDRAGQPLADLVLPVILPDDVVVDLLGVGLEQSAVSAVGSGLQRIYWLQAGMSQPRWVIDLPVGQLSDPYLLGHDSHGQLLLGGSHAVPDERVSILALAQSDGSTRWQYTGTLVGERDIAGRALARTAAPIIIPGDTLLFRSALPLANPIQSAWTAIDLKTGQQLWRNEQIGLPMLRESVGLIDGDVLTTVEVQADDPAQPKLRISERGLDGVLLRSAVLPLPAMTRPYSVSLDAAQNQDRLLIGVTERVEGSNASALSIRAVIDRENLQLLDVRPYFTESLAPAMDRGVVEILQCDDGSNCRQVRWYGSAGAPGWDVTLPEHWRVLATYHDGVLARRNLDALGFFRPDGNLYFERQMNLDITHPVRTADGAFAVLAASGMLLLLDPNTGQTLASTDLPGMADVNSLRTMHRTVEVNGESSQTTGGLKLVLADDTLALRAALHGETLSKVSLPALSPQATQASASRLQRGYDALDSRQEQLTLDLNPVQIQTRENLWFHGVTHEKSPNTQTLAVRDKVLLNRESSSRTGYGRVDVFSAYQRPPLTAHSELSLHTYPSSSADSMEILIRNDGPDATSARLQVYARHYAGYLSIQYCTATGAPGICGTWPGIDLPPLLELPAGAQLRYQLRHVSTSQYAESAEYALALDALPGTTELDRSDNRRYFRLTESLFNNGFE
jgi:outer membrane protein assembly factor BamB